MNEINLADITAIVSDVRTDPDHLLNYGRDWSRLHSPNPTAIVMPQTVEHVQQIMRYANEHRIALVPSGGRTGMSAAAVATQRELVLSFERMNQILHFDHNQGSITCQPGVITQTLQEQARQHGWFYPVDFGSRGSSQIGGNIATNAGGIKVIRYGLTRNWVTGLKVITGKGDLLDLNKGLIKNATGYDLRHLFIGSEGTLGCIVEATLQLTRPPQEPRVLVLGVNHQDAIMSIFGTFQRHLQLNAFEFFSQACLEKVLAKGLQKPFDTATPCDYYVLLEFDNVAESVMNTALELFEQCSNHGWVSDGVISENESQARELWRLREDITESIAEYLPYKNDISVPVAQVATFLAEMEQLFAAEYPDFEVLWFGHVGDGNLHINVLKPDALDHASFVERCAAVTKRLFETIQRYGGSISAEHGVGLTKKPYLQFSRDALEIDYMRAMKHVFDPNHIMNPGKIFD